LRTLLHSRVFGDVQSMTDWPAAVRPPRRPRRPEFRRHCHVNRNI